MHIRPFERADYEAAVGVWRAAGLTIKASDALPELLKLVARDPELFLVAAIEGAVAGTAVGAWDGRRAWVYHLAVLPELRHRGIGSRLMRELEDRFRERGALKVNLLVERRNARVAAFYERLGYAAADHLFMGKELSDSPTAPAAEPAPGRAASGER